MAEPTYGLWADSKGTPFCGSWVPSAAAVTFGNTFTQNSNCWMDQERLVQDREINSRSKATRNTGAPYVEYQTVIKTMSRQSVGTMASWVAASPVYSTWYNTGPLLNCDEWTPKPASNYTSDTQISQSSVCDQKQSASMQKREQNTATGQLRNVGTPTIEYRTIENVAAQRTYSVFFGGWANKGYYGNCSNWAPETSTVPDGQWFTQTASDCVQHQYRTHVEYYNDPSTGIRVFPVDTEEFRDIFVTDSRSAYGTKK